MPNWCMNKLIVKGKAAKLKEFKEAAEDKKAEQGGTALCLQKLIPMPKGLEGTSSPGNEKSKEYKALLKEHGFGDWYSWRLANWGIKWDLSADLTTETSRSLRYDFDSPWGPPTEAVSKLALMFPDLTFVLRYKEPGMGFAGVFKADGAEVQDESWNT